MYSKVKEWTKSFNLFIPSKLHLGNKEERVLRYNLSKEENEEYLEAKNIIDVADAVGDKLWLALGDCIHHGLDPEKLIDAIYTSNMSKLCKTKEEAEATRLHYLDKGIKVNIYKIINSSKESLFVVKNAETNKVLKSVNFKEPDFTYLLKEE